MARRKSRQAPPSNAFLISQALSRYQPLLSSEDFALLMSELSRPLYPALRANPLKVDTRRSMTEWSQRYGWVTRPVPYCPDGWWVVEQSTVPSQTIEHRLGYYYLQDAASMLPVELFDFGAEPFLVLDLAASPGGKSTHLAARMNGHGLLVANDASRSRITALRLVLQTWGAANSLVTNYPGERFGVWFPETFDRILLDAPCSMQNLRSTESHPLRPITPKEQQTLANRQASLISSAFQALKMGGQLVYSTCTLAPEEDEAVLDSLLRLYPGAVQVDDLSEHLPVLAPGLVGYEGIELHPELNHAARLWPHVYGTSGFFAARITKTQSVSTGFLSPPARPLEKTSLVRMLPKQVARLQAFFEGIYGFDLVESLSAQDLELYQRGSAVFALPGLFLRFFANLPFESVGLLLGEDAPDGFMPSHEWIARFGMQFTGGQFIISDENLAAWLRGEDLQTSILGFKSGSVVVVVDAAGRLLGRGKVQAHRLKNLLPRRLAF